MNFKRHKDVAIEEQVIKLEPIEVARLEPDVEESTSINTTIWSFPKRGSWATRKGDYRGNWAPQIPRALILNIIINSIFFLTFYLIISNDYHLAFIGTVMSK